jgi:hypothetical protein
LTQAPNYINHVALVLDASSSMTHLTKDLVRVADDQVRYLAERSTAMDQETRVTVYAFSYATAIRCLVFDKDVLRLPSIASLYRADGMTALIDATLKSQEDLAKTAQMYGDHAFLTYVLTDGMENHSRNQPPTLRRALAALPDNWTVAVLVPNRAGRQYAIDCGFSPGNVEEWDASSAKGLDDSFVRIRQATESFMQGRATGVRGSRAIFSTGSDAVNKQTIKAADLKPLKANQFAFLPVHVTMQIKPFVESAGRTFRVGSAYYPLTKTETIQDHKAVAIVRRKDGKVYTGQHARDLLGLPAMTVRVSPQHNPDFDVYVQSTSVNRKLVAGTKLLLVS